MDGHFAVFVIGHFITLHVVDIDWTLGFRHSTFSSEIEVCPPWSRSHTVSLAKIVPVGYGPLLIVPAKTRGQQHPPRARRGSHSRLSNERLLVRINWILGFIMGMVTIIQSGSAQSVFTDGLETDPSMSEFHPSDNSFNPPADAGINDWNFLPSTFD